MHRQAILSLLRAHQANQAESCQKMINFIESHPDCFERQLEIGHLTGSAWLVNQAGDKVLLTHHKKLNCWLQPGGHADGDTDIARVALKEAEEESGLKILKLDSAEIFDVDIHLIPARKNEPAHYHYDVRFVVRAYGDEQYEVSDESHDLAWVDIKALQQYEVDDSVLRMAEKWLAQTS